jgi:hypothetical protein
MEDGVDLETFAVFPLLQPAGAKAGGILLTLGFGFNKSGFLDKLAGKVVRTMHPIGFLVCCQRKYKKKR